MTEPSNKKLSRVRLELRDMYQQLFLGTLLGTIMRVSVDVLGILALCLTGYFLLEHFAPARECVRFAFEGIPEQVCWFTMSLLARLLFLLLLLSVGSYVSTRTKKKLKFQHSSSVTAGLLIVIIGAMLAHSYPLAALFAAFMLVFSFSFFGYRFWFYLRDRNKTLASSS